jgi:hypothetical protein
LTHISILLYIAIVRYILSIASYLSVVVAFMLWAAIGPFYAGASLVALIALAAVHPVVGFVIARWPAILLAVLLPVLAVFVPTPEDAREPIPMWFVMLIIGWPVGSALIMAGVGVGKVRGSWRSRAVA